MLKRVARFLVACALVLSTAAPLAAINLNLSEIETKDIRLIYQAPQLSYLAPYVAQCAENSLAFQEKLYGYRPQERLNVVLNDFSDEGNASTSTVPFNTVMVQVAPLSFAFETVMANERMNWIMNHEFVHVAMMDGTTREDRFFRHLFGGKVVPIAEDPESILYFYLTSPRIAAPRWYQEGIAVFTETWMAGGIGRAQGAYDEMVFRSMVRDHSHFYDPLGLVSEATETNFQVGVNWYLYGTRFLSYLAYRYSPQKLIQWVARKEGSKRYYADQFTHVFGMSLDQGWQQWVKWEHKFQEKNLAAINQYPTTPYHDLSHRALGSISTAYYDPSDHRLYAAFNYPGTVAYLGWIDTRDGSVHKLIDVKGPVLYTVTSLAWDPVSQTLFYTTDNLAYRDLREVDVKTGKSRTLLKDVRVGYLAFDRADRSIWGVRTLNGIATLVRIPYPYKEWQQIKSLPYGEVAYDLDVSPDGKDLVASFGEIDGTQKLQVMKISDLRKGELKPIKKYEFGDTVPENFVFSSDGRYLYGTSYLSGVSNVFRYTLASGKMNAMTNTDTGFFRPIPLEDGSLIVFRYSGSGFVPAMIDHPHVVTDIAPITFLGHQIAEKYPIVQKWSVGSPARIPIKSMIEKKGPYEPLHMMRVSSFYPIVEGYKNSKAVGMRLNFSDPIGINRASLKATYTPDNTLPSKERLHLAFDYQRYDWHLRAKWNAGDFYDLFGPTKRSRKGYSIGIGYDRMLIYDQPRTLEVKFDTAYYGDIERLPSYQNIASPATRLSSTEVSLTYSNERHSLGHVDQEKGVKWQLFAHNDWIPGDDVPSIFGTLDLGVALPIPHSSIWLRSAAGVAFGRQADPIANFYFGGFGNNYVDHLQVKRYREYYSFPGVGLNSIAGRTFAKSMLEWNLPPIRFRKFGTPGFYISWARPAIFASGILTNLSAPSTQQVRASNVGAQLDFRMSVLSRLQMTLSLGYAVAFPKGQPSHDEFMASLKVM